MRRGNASGTVQSLVEPPSTSRRPNVNQRQLTGFPKRAMNIRNVGGASRDPTSNPKRQLSINLGHAVTAR
jgi:hypothetical protein